MTDVFIPVDHVVEHLLRGAFERVPLLPLPVGELLQRSFSAQQHIACRGLRSVRPRSAKENLMSSSIRPNRHRKTAAASIAAAATAFVASVLVAPAATAASATPGDFSSLTARANPQRLGVDDCTIEVGVVVDATPYPDYHHVGGVRVNCSSRHSVMDATVALYHWNGSRFVQYGAGAYGARYSTTGSGYGVSGILRTPAYCVGSLRTQEWIVGATVRTENTGRTVFSTWQKDTAAGC